MELSKKMSINLSKGEDSIKEVILGCSWGETGKSIDIDTMIFGFSGTKLVDSIYYGRKENSFIKHFGDDLSGGTNSKQHESDNEVIFVSLEKATKDIDRLLFYVDSYSNFDLSKVPNLSVRLYLGVPGKPTEVLCTIKANQLSQDSKGVIVGEFVRKDKEWKFNSILEDFSSRGVSNASKNAEIYVSKERILDTTGAIIDNTAKVVSDVLAEADKVSTSFFAKVKNLFK